VLIEPTLGRGQSGHAGLGWSLVADGRARSANPLLLGGYLRDGIPITAVDCELVWWVWGKRWEPLNKAGEAKEGARGNPVPWVADRF